MSKIVVKRDDKTFHLEKATVQDVIDLMDEMHKEKRAELLEDLDAAGVTGGEKIEALSELRKTKGITSDLVRSAFTLNGAKKIIEFKCQPGEMHGICDCAPDEVVYLALEILGFDREAFETSEEDKKEEPAENPQ
jgi:hypothetical protein